jgi:hypothetical protein
MADPKIGENTLEITLADEPHPVVLTCDVGACIRLCNQRGGLDTPMGFQGPHDNVTTRLLSMDISTMAEIIRAGRNIRPGAVPDLEAKIFKTGLFNVVTQLAPFIGMVKNGGVREPEATEDSGGAAGKDERPPKA